MPCPSVVRPARPQDHREIWRLFLQGHRENGMFTLAPEKVEWHIQRALYPQLIPDWDMGTRPVIGVIGDVGALEGLVLISLGSMWYSNDRHLEEYIVYVDPECRKSFHARALISWMKERSNKTNLPLLTGIISNVRTQPKVDLYSRMLPRVGAFFLHHPHDAGVMPSSAAYAA